MKKYEIIFNDLKQGIISGKFSDGERLPPEEALAKKYQTSRVPVQQALNALAGISMVKRIAGSGTYITYSSNLNMQKNRNTVFLLNTLDAETTKIIDGVQSVMQKQGLFLTTKFSQFDPKIEKDVLDELNDGNIAGLLIYTTETNLHRGEIYNALNHKKPIVFVDKSPNRLIGNTVMSDPQQGMFLLVKHLVEHGHKKIAFIGHPLQTRTSVKQRFDATCAAMNFFDIPLEHRYLRFSHDPKTETRALLTMDDPPTAIIYASSFLYYVSLPVFHELNFSIPEDVSVVAHDRIQRVEESDMPVTNVDQDFFGIGSVAAKRLFEIMVNPDCGFRTEYLPVTFHDEGTVRYI